MKKIILLAVLLTCVIFSSYAQFNSDVSPRLCIGVGGGTTQGTYSAYYPVAGALDLKLEYPVTGVPVDIVFKTGLTFFLTSNGYAISAYYGEYGSEDFSGQAVSAFVPAEAGFKVYVSRRIFFEGDLGLSMSINTPDFPTKMIAPIVSPSIGYSIPFDDSDNKSWDLSLGYENRIEAGGGYSQIAIRAAFRFGI